MKTNMDIGIMGPNTVIGVEDAANEEDGCKYHITAECISDVVVYELQRTDFLRELKKQPNILELISHIQERRENKI